MCCLGSFLRFYCGVDRVINSVLREPGTACRISNKFENQRMLFVFYKSFFRSLLEYATPHWTRICETDSLRAEPVQKVFRSMTRCMTSVSLVDESFRALDDSIKVSIKKYLQPETPSQ